MKIKKFNNGNINLKLEKNDFFNGNDGIEVDALLDIDALYYNELSMDDLGFNQINGYMYLLDVNTSHVYDFSQCYINILKYLAMELIEGYKMNTCLKLYSLSSKECKSLLQNLENGY